MPPGVYRSIMGNQALAYGLIAQEVEQIIPGIVHNRIDGTKTVSYMQLIAFLLQAIKEQNIIGVI